MWSQIRSWFVARGSWFVKYTSRVTSHQSPVTVILLAGLLSACGFQPLYGSKEGFKERLASVYIDPIPERMGQVLKTKLEDKLNPRGLSENPDYRLIVTLTSTASAMGVGRDGTISRYNVNLTSSYQLLNAHDNSLVTSGDLRHTSSYNNVSNAYFSTFVSEQDAIKRGVAELAELYRQRLAAYLAHPTTKPIVKDPKASPKSLEDLVL